VLQSITKQDDKFIFERWRRNALPYASSQAFIEGQMKETKISNSSPNNSEDNKSENLFTFMLTIYRVMMITGFILVAIHIQRLL
jgi:hypothetical protein